MGKLYFSCCFLWLFFSADSFAQSPIISYPASKKFTVGVKISPVQPVSTGGAVPVERYSKVSTVAGSGLYGYKDTLAQFARFSNPVSVAHDHKGNKYVADANLNLIRKISASGMVSTFAGNTKKGALNGQDTAARFNYPTGVTCDKAGNVYVADFGNSMIRKITPSGKVSTLAGHVNTGNTDGVGTAARFTLPYNLICDKDDNLYVADSYNNKIRKISITTGNVTTFAGSGIPALQDGLGKNASFKLPYALAVDDIGFIYVADQGNGCVRKISPDGSVQTLTDTIYKDMVGIAVDKTNRIYLSNQNNFHIVQLNRFGKPTSNIPFSGGSYKNYLNATDTLSSYKGSMSLTFDGGNNLLIADPYNGVIRKVAVNGYTITPALPAGLTIDSTGAITGTPEGISSATDYTVTAYNDYGSGSSKINIAVGIGSQTITFKKPAPVTYGDADFDPIATSTDTLIKIVYSSSNPAVATIVKNRVHIVGQGTTVITANQPGNVNYTPAPAVSQTLTVNKALLTVTAVSITRNEGKDNPPLQVSYQGFVNQEDVKVLTKTAVAATTATANAAVGKYAITVAGAEAGNYAFKYVSGELTVFPVPVVTAEGSTFIVKGGFVTLNASPQTGYTYQWAMDGINIPGATKASYQATKTGGYSVSITANNYTSYSLFTSVVAQLKLPQNNFSLKLTGITCKGSNNGSIQITAAQSLKYVATITGNSLNTPYPFTNTLSIPNLSPGNYSVCITVDNEAFSQCYQVNVEEPKDLSVYSTVNSRNNNINLQLNGGHTFNITLNDVSYSTTQSEITLPLLAGSNKLMVTTDNLCQGVFEKTIVVNDKIVPFPNPFNNVLYVNIGNSKVSNIKISVAGLVDGKRVYNTQYTNRSGIIELDLSSLVNGLYYINLSLDDKLSGYKIIKK